ncbi:protein kinase domain-containing protein [Fimbriiglobus ruber]|uniref:Serine/threonine protein kinase n=1 Tax=Fimbriiglobus ruber TaxID=1908690 RepID=A0A225DZF3_9BACT|nr:tubulin-like doman-containing protein [Fimbriiglobus ruber]OWK43898.1 serine/threonine protein kinase [Fimbriiglobus ruber]
MNWLREPETEPIPGYRLVEPLGTGGFGEVWKCVAPGGINKAIKFVYGNLNTLDDDSHKAEQELKALERVKAVRHPFVLSMDRIEIVGGELLIVMELADKSLHDLLLEYQQTGRPGIPRDVLLGLMADAAEGLDHLIQKHNLQHLDVKPKNLFLIADRVKVADFGLVKHLERQSYSGLMGGITPVYAAPETFTNKISEHTDQYSLAVLYTEMLTGHRPFDGKNIRQLALQHMSEAPDLSGLPEPDRAAVARAMAKNPDDRFPSCAAFVRAITGGPLRADPADATSDGSIVETPAPIRTRSNAPSDTGTPSTPVARIHKSKGTNGTPLPITKKTSYRPPVTPFPANQSMSMSVSFRPEEGVLRPVILIGIGSFGRRALQHVRCRLLDRVGELSLVPCIRFIYVDTDPDAPAKVASGPADAALLPDHLFHAPLQPVTGYRRRQLDQILDWLPREKLYAIPRSLRSDGSRALGRLAFCDHYLRFMTRLRHEIQFATHPEAVSQSSNQTGLTVRTKVPSVYVLASASGGSSGLLLDLGHAVRRELERFNIPDAPVTAFVFAGAPDDPTSPPAELSNIFATLTELNHYADPDVSFAAQYGGPEGPQVDASGLPFNATYLLPMAQRTSEAFRDTLSHLAGYLTHDLTTPLGTGLEKIRRGGVPFGRTPFRGFGTFGVWYPRGLLLRSAARQLCVRFLRGWTAERVPALPDEAERILNHILTDPRLTPEEVRVFVAAEAAIGVDGNPVEGMKAWACNLARQASDAARTADPPGWAVSAWDQTRDWLGMEATTDADSPFRRGRLSRALDQGLRRSLDAWCNELTELLRPLDELAGPRLAATETIVRQLIAACAEASTATEKQLAGFGDARVRARNDAQAAVEGCVGVSEGGPSFGLFGSRIGRSLRAVAEKIKIFADVRIQEDLASVTAQFYRRLGVWFEDKLRDLAFAREQLADLATAMEAQVLLPGTGSTVTGGQEPHAESEEGVPNTLQGSNTMRVVLPFGEDHLDRSASELLAQLPPDKPPRLELILTRLVIDPRGGLVGACRASSELFPFLAGPMVEQATAYLTNLLPCEDVTEVELSAAGAGPGDINRRVASYIRAAAPLVTGPSEEERTFVMLPDSTAGLRYAEEVTKAVPSATTVPVRGAVTDLLFCREQGCLRTADLFRLLEPCWEAYHQAATNLETNPHARFDVTGWVPLVE